MILGCTMHPMVLPLEEPDISPCQDNLSNPLYTIKIENSYNGIIIRKTNQMKKMKLIEAMRECGRHIWLCETNQISYNEIELQQLRVIEENILVYLAEGTVGLETALQNKRNHNSDNRKLISSNNSLTPIDSDHT
jgi:hypothetical protein